MSFDFSTAKHEDDSETEGQSFDFSTATHIPEAVSSDSMTELASDQFKQGLVDLAMGVMPDSLVNLMQGRDLIDPEITRGSQQAHALDATDRATSAQMLGLEVKNIQPKTIAEKVVANIARAGGDPLSYIGGAGPKLARPFVAAIESAVGTATGTVGGEAAAMGAQSLGAEAGGYAEQAARIVGGGFAGGVPATSVLSLGKATVAATKAAYNAKGTAGDVGKAINEGETYIASKQVSNLISEAIKTDPSLEAKIGHVEAVLKDFPDLNIGPWAAMTENPILRENLTYLLRTNPSFHAKIKTQIAEAESLINQRQQQVFKEGGSKAERQVYAGLEAGHVAAKDTIANINKMLNGLSAKADPEKVRTPEQLGRIVQGLVDRKKKAVQKEMSPLYDNLFNNARDNGVEFSASSVENMYRFAKDEVGELFGVMPREYREIINKWKPTPQRDDSGKIIKGPDNKPIMEFSPSNVRQLDSLKKAVNAGLRNSNIKGDSRARLDNLKTMLDGEIREMGDFGAAYKGLDFEYWQRLGIPLNKEGIKDISTKKFADQVAPLLARPEQAREFLSMVGDMGKPVVAQSILTSLSTKAYNPKTGELDINAVEKYRIDPKNRDVIEMSGMTEVFKDVTGVVKALDEQRASLSTRYIEGSVGYTKDFFGRMNETGIDGVMADLLKSPAATQRHLDFVKGLDPESQQLVMTGLKAELARKAIDSGKGSMDFIKENQRAFDDVFGKGMYEDLKSLADMQDIIGEVHLDKIQLAAKHAKLEDPLQKKTGVPLQQVNSLLRDRIMSAHQKMFVFLNKMNSARIDKREEQMMIELFTKEGAMSEIKKTADALKLEPNKPEALRAFADSINKTFAKGVYMGVEAAEEEQKRMEAP